MRLYVPTTRTRLAAHVGEGVVRGFEEPFVATGEGEDEEYAALMAAAEGSAALQPEDGRRVVLVVEVPVEAEEIAWHQAVAVHADLAGASPVDDLAWYATQEIADLLAE